jgi:hypothetical protein
MSGLFGVNRREFCWGIAACAVTGVAWSAGATRERAAYELVAATDRAWPYRKDVEHFDALPVRSPGLLFAGLACGRREYVDLWQTMDPDPRDAEIIRNYPVRQPLLWV